MDSEIRICHSLEIAADAGLDSSLEDLESVCQNLA